MVEPTPLKNMTSSVGIVIPNIWKVIKFMFQTTNQSFMIFYLLVVEMVRNTLFLYSSTSGKGTSMISMANFRGNVAKKQQ